jgi:ubiquitin carboxyl-terminal hydrolase 7
MQLENGDIICFQKASAMDNVKLIRYPDVPSYLKYVRSRKVFVFEV